MKIRVCEQCGYSPAGVIHKLPYLNVCTPCYRESMNSWNNLTESEKEGIRNENREMGVKPID
jgi:hypothetical protein